MARTFPDAAVAPEDALKRLREGNRRFVAGEGCALRNWHPGLADGQSPFAVVFGCSDSRAPAEYVFDQGLGDLFVIRVAGNIIAPSLVGSVEFAASTFGTRLVVVMGHTQCGAVAATMDAMAKEHTPIPAPVVESNMPSIIDRITPHVRHLVPGSMPDEELMNEAIRTNAIASARELKVSSPVLSDLVDAGRVAIAAALYDLATGVVTFLD